MPAAERGERRGRRRGRGRGRGRQVRDEQPAGEEGSVDEGEFDFDGAEEEDTVDTKAAGEQDQDGGEHDFDDDEEHDGESDEDGGESPRIGFRNIPTWQDAIGVMIAKNMESRSRNPAVRAARAGVAAAVAAVDVAAAAGPIDGKVRRFRTHQAPRDGYVRKLNHAERDQYVRICHPLL